MHQQVQINAIGNRVVPVRIIIYNKKGNSVDIDKGLLQLLYTMKDFHH